ncbi:hypothetical protein OEA41_008965 [Lepraria neglecta]|uniref:Uncharacterized protein n=1 Tax=Lepraria neglecta TaxID=209136 RepID=A0AAD9Z2D0_9LECA|nr:hypothetical protein OEA41_008965 [Lepraria neglecta]
MTLPVTLSLRFRSSSSDGTLSNPVRTSTGGKGLAGLLAICQDSVVVDDHYLFTVNAGDDTFSLFTINGDDPEYPKLAGKPLPTLGQTPLSVAYSPELQTACVLNSGSTAGISCFSISPDGATLQGGLRPIAQIEFNATAPPLVGPLVIGADITFNPSSTALFATIANGTQAGTIYAYPIKNGHISTAPVISSFPTLSFTFSLNFLDNSDTHLLVTNPHLNSPGAAFVSISYPSLEITLAKTITIPGQIASCWAAYAPQFDTVYVMDGARPKITALNPETGDVKGQVSFPAAAAGGLDSRVDRDWFYTLTDDLNDPKVNVFEIVGGPALLKQVQSFDIFQQVGKIPDLMGMAIWPN